MSRRMDKRDINKMVSVLVGTSKIDGSELLGLLNHKMGMVEFYRDLRKFIGDYDNGVTAGGGEQLLITSLYANYVIDWSALPSYEEYVKEYVSCSKQQNANDRERGIIKSWRAEQFILYILSLYTGNEELIKRYKESLLAPYGEKEPQELVGRGSEQRTYVAFPVLSNQQYVKHPSYSVDWSGRVVITNDMLTDVWGSYGKTGWDSRKGELNLFQEWILNLLLFEESKGGLYAKIVELKKGGAEHGE